MTNGNRIDMPLLCQVIVAARREGVRRLIGRVCRQLLKKPVLQRYAVILREISEDMPLLEAKIPVTCAVLQREELESYASVDYFQKSLAILKSRLDEGQVGFVAKHNGRIVAGGWIEFGTARSTGSMKRAFPLAADEAYLHSGFTVQEYWGNRVRPTLLSFQCNWLTKANYRRTVGFIASSNKSSLRAFPKSGGRRVGTVGYLEILGWRWHFCLVKRGVFGEMDKRNYFVRI